MKNFINEIVTLSKAGLAMTRVLSLRGALKARRSNLVSLIILILLSNLSAYTFDYYGYYEPQVLGFELNDVSYSMITNKVRLDTRLDYNDKISFLANYNFIHYSGKRDFNVLDSLPDTLTASISIANRELYKFEYDESAKFDNAFIKISLNKLDLTIGKQQISLGSGYAWNPTDIFNDKDLMDPTYEQPGHNAVRVDLPLAKRLSIMTLYNYEDTWNESVKVLRVKTGLWHFDFSMYAMEKEEILVDYISFTSLEQRRRIFGYDYVGEFLGMGSWTEYAYNEIDTGKNYTEVVSGLDYTFHSGLYLMVEYFFNDRGKENSKNYTLNDWMRYFSGEQKSVSRDQIYSMFTYPITDLINIGCSNIVSLNDYSSMFIPTLTYSISDDLQLTTFLSLNTGKTSTAYSNTFGNSAFVRLRIYY